MKFGSSHLLNSRLRFRVKFTITFLGLIGLLFPKAIGQTSHKELADSILKAFDLPALGYAVISADSILEMEVVGVKRLGFPDSVTLQDHFRIGSNTKAFTALMAELIVSTGKINWDTKFFDLFPKWKIHSQPAYYSLTLQDLITFRNKLPMWTYSFPEPKPSLIKGNAAQQRTNFGKWLFQQAEEDRGSPWNHSNLGYVAAGLMLEKATGVEFERLAADLGELLQIKIGFGQPNASDSAAVWGHNANLKPEAPAQNVRLNWLMAAGNIQISLPDHAAFLQFFLRGMKGKAILLNKSRFEHLLFGVPDFAFGWFWEINENGEPIAHNLGNPGSFLSRVLINPSRDRAYIVVTNCMTDLSYEGTELLMDRLQD